MTQLSIRKITGAEQGSPVDRHQKPAEVERLAQLVQEIRADAKQSPRTYLEETVVPEGGE